MQKYKIIVTWEAVYDVTEIADYTEAQFGIARADRFQEDIKEHLNKPEIMGGILGKTYLCYREYSIYKSPFPPSIIFLHYHGTRKRNPCLKGTKRGT